jgi:WD40 repeat protein
MADRNPRIPAESYSAFISYRHIEPDRKWAKWLHSRLETYKVPSQLLARGIPAQVARVFRDEEELAASSNLSTAIQHALEQSNCLIVVCSPRTPLSNWVNAEVERFHALGRRDKVFALLIEGEPEASFPPLLRSSTEPLAADIRPVNGETPRQSRETALLKLLAGVLNCNFDELRQRHQQRARRRLTQLVAGLTLLLVTVAALGVYAWKQRSLAEEKARIALSNQLAAQSLSESNRQYDLSLLLAVQSHKVANTIDARSSLLTAIAVRSPLSTFLRFNGKPVKVTAFSPDCKTLVSGGFDGHIASWDVTTLKRNGEINFGENVDSVAFTPDGRYFAAGGWDKIWIWDMNRRTQLRTPILGHKEPINGLAFNSDGSVLASASQDGTAILWNWKTGKKIGNPLRPHKRGLTSIAFSVDDKMLAASTQDDTVMLWSTKSRNPIATPLTRHQGEVHTVAFNPNPNLPILASAGIDQSIVLWDLPHRRPIGEPLRGHTNAIWRLAFSPDGQRLASAGADGSVILWRLVWGGAGIEARLDGHIGDVQALSFNCDGRLLASGGDDGTVAVWDIARTYGPDRAILKTDEKITAVALASNGDALLAEEGQLLVSGWNSSSSELYQFGTGHKRTVNALAMTSDGKRIAVAGDGAIISIIDGTTRNVLPGFSIPSGAVITGLAFAPDGMSLASRAEDDSVTVWDIKTAAPKTRPLVGPPGPVGDIKFSPNGLFLAASGVDGKIMIWDTAAWQRKAEFALESSIDAITFSPDNKILVSGDAGGVITFWDLNTRIGQPVADLKKSVISLAFSPNGKQLAALTEDGRLLLWDVDAQRPIGVPLGFKVWMSMNKTALTFSDDGKTLTTTQYGGQVVQWDLDPKSWEQYACRMANRNLTAKEWGRFIGGEPTKTCPEFD